MGIQYSGSFSSEQQGPFSQQHELQSASGSAKLLLSASAALWYGRSASAVELSNSLPVQRHPTRLQNPLRVVSVGPGMLRGGAEQRLVNLARFLDPRRVQILRAIVTNPGFVDPAFVAEVRFPVEEGRGDVVRGAASACDVLLCWGIELDEILRDCRPKLCVFVARARNLPISRLCRSAENRYRCVSDPA